MAAPGRLTRRSASRPATSTQVPEALKGQLAVSATDADGNLRDATGVQIPGVLDDLYANDGALGVDLGRQRADGPRVGADRQVRRAAPVRGRDDGDRPRRMP